MDTLLEAPMQYLRNCCLIIFMTVGLVAFVELKMTSCDSNGVEL